MPTWNSKKLVKRLLVEGWYETDKEGSHAQFKHPEKAVKVTIPHPRRDIPIGTAKSIDKQAGWKWGT